MSTRSVVAVPFGDGWRGRYTHWDGYPTSRGKSVWELVQRDGLEKVRRVIIDEHFSWSTIDPDQPDLTGVHVPKDYDEARKFGYGSPEYTAFRVREQCDGNVPGYGIGSSKEPDYDAWVVSDGDDCGTEWAYVLADSSLFVFQRRYGSRDNDQGYGMGMFGLGASDTEAGGYWALAANVEWTAKEPDWGVIETFEPEGSDKKEEVNT